MSDADAKATFELDLQDGASSGAESAATALRKLREEIDGDLKQLANMQKALRNLKAGGMESSKQFGELKAKIDAHKKAIGQNQAAYLGLGGAFKDTSKKGRSAFQQLADSSKGLGGPVAGLIGQFEALGAMLKGGAIALGVAAIAAALALLVVASAAAVGALVRYGIAQADARRNELLRLEGLTKLRSFWGFAAGNAKEMQGAIDRVSAGTSISREEVGKYGDALYRAGLRGTNYAKALEATAMRAAVLGEEHAHAFVGMAAGVNLAGGSIDKLADRVKNRLGRVAQEQMKGLGVQSMKLHEGFAAIFADLNIEPFLAELNRIKNLFTQNTAAGRALKFIMTTLVQPLINGLTFAAPLAKRFFQGMIIAALVLTIAFLKLRNYVRDTFAGSDVLSGMDLQTVALYGGVAAVGALGVAFVVMSGLVVGALALALPFIWGAVAAVGALALSGLALAAPFILGAIAVGALIAAGYQLYKLWQEIDWSSLGTAIVDGIVGGLSSAKKWAVDSIKGLGTELLSSFKDTLGIASPSKAFARLGVTLPQGVEQGVEQGSPAAQRSVDDMVTPRVPGFGRGGAGGVNVSIGDVYLNTTADTARDIAGDIKRELQRMLEGVAIELGAA